LKCQGGGQNPKTGTEVKCHRGEKKKQGKRVRTERRLKPNESIEKKKEKKASTIIDEGSK